MDFTLPDYGESLYFICEYVDKILHNVKKAGATFYLASHCAKNEASH